MGHSHVDVDNMHVIFHLNVLLIVVNFSIKLNTVSRDQNTMTFEARINETKVRRAMYVNRYFAAGDYEFFSQIRGQCKELREVAITINKIGNNLNDNLDHSGHL